MYNNNTIYVVGHGKTGSDNAITDTFRIFFLGIVIDRDTDEIIDIECTATIGITSRFVHDIFVGRKLDCYDESLVDEISNRYFGSSQKAIIVAYRDALKKYLELKKNN